MSKIKGTPVPKLSGFPVLKGRNGFTIVELLIVITIVSILTALLFSAARSAIATSQVSQCTHNLQQIGAAMNLYAGDDNGVYPGFPTNTDVSQGAYYVCDVIGGGTARWKYFGVLYGNGYLKDPRVFYCPVGKKGSFDYLSQWAANAKGQNTFSGLFRIGYYQRIVDATFPVPGRLSVTEGKMRVLMTDANSSSNSLHPPARNSTANNVSRGINVLFNDGHVKYDGSGVYWNQPNQWAYGNWEASP